ncbi:LPO_1073/Vpar_1526 family protein [Amycolatopsis sp. NPDC023774]|uniref:LPO_1073/Vpar_1526 family protein n=1 Tax=Amycolatopsis sp. NPDC023774 TaxID=3155015 RepID=UPI0033D32DAA
MSAPEVYEIARQVFRDNFPKLSEEASRLATMRAEKLVEEFIEKAADRGGRLSAIADPDFQYSLLLAQRDYARSGDDSLKGLLTDLLVQRSSTDGELERVVLAESLETVRKLTARQIAAVTVSWFFARVSFNGLDSLEEFIQVANKNVAPFVDSLPVSNSEYQHIQYTGCASLASENRLGQLAADNYPGLFNRGFQANSVPTELWADGVREQLFIPCLHDDSHWQVRAKQESAARELVRRLDLERYESEYLNLLLSYKMEPAQVEKWLRGVGEFWPNLIETWQKTSISEMYLSSVGTAIGHANWSRVVGDKAPLSIWVNELGAN